MLTNDEYEAQRQKLEKERDIALVALNAIDGAMSTLLMARTIVSDRLDGMPNAQPEVDPMATMTGTDKPDCAHRNVKEKEVMGGVTLRFCNDCGGDLNDSA